MASLIFLFACVSSGSCEAHTHEPWTGKIVEYSPQILQTLEIICQYYIHVTQIVYAVRVCLIQNL